MAPSQDGNAALLAQGPHLSPDLDLARLHVELITGEPDTPICWRLLRGREDAGINLDGDVATVWPEIIDRQREGWQAYVIPNAGGHTDAEITETRCLFIDMDGEPPPAAWHVEPDFLVIRDNTHWHAYWRLARRRVGFTDQPALSPTEFKTAQRRLAAFYGSDPTVCNPSRVMRVAGSLHCKLPPKGDGKVRLVTIEDHNPGGMPHGADELLAGLPEVATVASVRKAIGDLQEDKPEAVRQAKFYLDNKEPPVEFAGSDDACYKVAAKLYRDLGLSFDTVLDMMSEWSGFDPDWLAEKIEHAAAHGQNDRGSDVPTSSQEAFGAAVTKLAAAGLLPPASNDDTAPTNDDDLAPAIGSDLQLSVAFEAAYRDDLRFITERNQWVRWWGQRWREVTQPGVWNLLRPIACDLARGFDSANMQKQMCSSQRITAAERQSRGPLEAPAAIWDTDPYQLNTPAGVVDLRTGTLSPSNRDAHCLKMTAVAPGGDCPRWRQFLDEVTAGDIDLQLYLQRLAGYSLVGEVKEHVLAFFYGTGGNGKGKFLEAVAGMMGSYSTTAPMGAFTETTNDRHPTDMAMLQGARLVTGQEVEAGRAWAEAKIKALTGGDEITARFMHCNNTTFTPQFTLIMTGNHKPRLHHVDEAIRRRLHMILFTVTIAQPDIHLAEKLRGEWPGILRWAIDGCLSWQRLGGLHAPQSVLDLTERYLMGEDPAAEWLKECCVRDKFAKTGRTMLYLSYQGAVDGVAMRDRDFYQWLEDHGFVAKMLDGQRVFQGVRLLAKTPFQ